MERNRKEAFAVAHEHPVILAALFAAGSNAERPHVCELRKEMLDSRPRSSSGRRACREPYYLEDLSIGLMRPIPNVGIER